MDPRQTLAHALMMKFELPPGRPTDDELDFIVDEISSKLIFELTTEADWERSVRKHVLLAGRYKRGGEDFSDLTALLQAVLRQARSGK
jgi:hypothetical protein